MTPQEREEYIRNKYCFAPKPFVDWFVKNGGNVRNWNVARHAWQAATDNALDALEKVPGSQLAAWKLRQDA